MNTLPMAAPDITAEISKITQPRFARYLKAGVVSAAISAAQKPKGNSMNGYTPKTPKGENRRIRIINVMAATNGAPNKANIATPTAPGFRQVASGNRARGKTYISIPKPKSVHIPVDHLTFTITCDG